MYYAFDFITEDDVIDHVDVGVYDDDDAAQAAAERALGRSLKSVIVRVWRDRACVAEARRSLVETGEEPELEHVRLLRLPPDSAPPP